jgi:hypothetical protein
MSDRVTDPADPERCQGVAPDGQCRNKREPGSNRCFTCLRGKSIALANELKLYHLTEARYRQKLAQLAEHDPLHALREAIALSIRLTEKRFNLVENDTEFLRAYGEINMLLLTRERLVKSAHVIEQELGVLIGKPTVLRLGQLVIHFAADELKTIPDYSQIMLRISDQIVEAITLANNDSLSTPLPILKRARAEGAVFKLEDADDAVRVANLCKHDRLKSLTEDIYLAIVMVERRANMVKTKEDFISACSDMSTGLRTLEKLIKSAHDIEQTLGNLLNPDAIRRLGQAVSEILVDELESAGVPDHELVVDRIMERVANGLTAQAVARLTHQ